MVANKIWTSFVVPFFSYEFTAELSMQRPAFCCNTRQPGDWTKFDMSRYNP